MKRSKTQKGITLIALIITIVVLMILSVVAISSIQNDGILSYANNAVKDYEQAQKNEQEILDGYLSYMPGNNGGLLDNLEEVTFLNAQTETMLTKTSNSVTVDEYGNKIVVPAGFKITTDANNVTEGIVIEDNEGNQFVWVAVGTVYTNVEKTESETITLGRYSWDGSVPTLVQPTSDNSYTSNVQILNGDYNYTEYQVTTESPNAKAKNIKDFYEATTKNGGYYIGRYEAGVVNYDADNITTSNSNSETSWTGYKAIEGEQLQLVCRTNEQVWNYVTQSKASELSQGMYANVPFSSDLINSYAWDTALVFIQTFSSESDGSSYASLNKSTALTVTGGNGDEYCNINDMSGNRKELTTEYSDSADNGNCGLRGGSVAFDGSKNSYAGTRFCTGTTNGGNFYSFRPIIYLAQ